MAMLLKCGPAKHLNLIGTATIQYFCVWDFLDSLEKICLLKVPSCYHSLTATNLSGDGSYSEVALGDSLTSSSQRLAVVYYFFKKHKAIYSFWCCNCSFLFSSKDSAFDFSWGRETISTIDIFWVASQEQEHKSR